jgi:hypothetical protein
VGLLCWCANPAYCLLLSLGQYGASSVRKTTVDTGVVQAKTPMSNSHFGEGLTRFGDKLYQITWLTNEGFIYSIPDLKQVCSCLVVADSVCSCRPIRQLTHDVGVLCLVSVTGV